MSEKPGGFPLGLPDFFDLLGGIGLDVLHLHRVSKEVVQAGELIVDRLGLDEAQAVEFVLLDEGRGDLGEFY